MISSLPRIGRRLRDRRSDDRPDRGPLGDEVVDGGVTALTTRACPAGFADGVDGASATVDRSGDLAFRDPMTETDERHVS
jgi:hypothetical protein